MRVEKKEVLVEQTIYIANDGALFSSEKDCLHHEACLALNSAKAHYERLCKFQWSPPYADIDYVWEWVYCLAEEDLAAAKAALFEADSVAHEYEVNQFPEWICCVYTCDGAGYIAGNINNVAEELRSAAYDLFTHAINATNDFDFTAIEPKKEG